MRGPTDPTRLPDADLRLNDKSEIRCATVHWPTWFFRPDLPLGAPLPTSGHVPNSSSVLTSSPLPSRTHLETAKGSEPSSNSNNKVHGQTPTICTVSDTFDHLILPTGPR
ncbi:hypothetical protein HN011_004195 [Eciton burchellii]|nr:hypothetical protein HN011_004195 [Eciton burchellii]